MKGHTVIYKHLASRVSDPKVGRCMKDRVLLFGIEQQNVEERYTVPSYWVGLDRVNFLTIIFNPAI